MCESENESLAALTDRLVGNVDNADAKALIRILSYAADQTKALNAHLTYTLLKASIEALSLEGGHAPVKISRTRKSS